MLGLLDSCHAFGFLALLIEFSCATQRDACLTCIAKRSGTRRCLASSGFAHRRRRRMLTRCRCGRRLALSGLAHDRRWGMLGGCAGCPLLRRGRLARVLTTHVLGRRCLALSRLVDEIRIPAACRRHRPMCSFRNTIRDQRGLTELSVSRSEPKPSRGCPTAAGGEPLFQFFALLGLSFFIGYLSAQSKFF